MHKVKLISKKRVTTSKSGPDSTHYHQQLNGGKKAKIAEIGSKLHKTLFDSFLRIIIYFQNIIVGNAQFTWF